FAVVDLSAFYFDVLKDRLYTFAPRNRARRSAQTAIYRIAGALLRLIAPLLAFTSEEIWKYFPRQGEPSSVHLAEFPTQKDLGGPTEAQLNENWEKLLNLRRTVLTALEAARNKKLISGALEAKVLLNAGSPEADLWRRYARWLPALFIVSQVEFVQQG